MTAPHRFASLAAAFSLSLVAMSPAFGDDASGTVGDRDVGADGASVVAPAGAVADGAIRVLVTGSLDRVAIAAQIAAELGVATSIVDDEAACAVPCAMISHDGTFAAVHMIGASGTSLSRMIELPDGPAAAEIVALVVGNLARDESAILLARLAASGVPAGAGAAGHGPVVVGGAGAAPSASAPVIVPVVTKPARRAAADKAAAGKAAPHTAAAAREPEAPARFSVGLIPPLTLGVDGPRGGGGLALDVLVGGHRRLAAFNLAGVGSIVTQEVKGTQIAGVAAGAGEVEGAQLAGAIAVSRTVHGAQIGGAIAVARDVDGTQAAGAIVTSGSVRGAQIGGVLAASGDVHGTQAGGAVALARDVDGAQAGGAVAIARAVRGAQIGGAAAISAGMVHIQVAGAAAVAGGDVTTQVAGAVNVAGGEVRGLQVAPFNLARRVDGVQVGVVNVSGGGEGVSIGLLNLVRGGRTELEATLDQRKLGALVLRHGGRRFHNVYGVAARAERELLDDNLADDDVWMYGLGLGPSWHHGRSTIDLEAMAWHVVYGQRFTDELDLLAQLRLVVGHPVGPAHVVVGGALNTYVTTDEHRPSAFSARVLPGTPMPAPDPDAARVRVELWPSLFVGVRL